MDDDARRLVHNEEVLVLPRDSQRHLLPFEPGRHGLGDGQLELLAALQPMRLRPALPVQERGALLQQPLGRPARADLGQRGEKAIQPLACGLRGDDDS
jgi:hypothetical protein